MENDARFTSQFNKVYTYAEWAEEQGLNKADVGVDLVAKLADGTGFCAVQCKLYAKDAILQKAQINSFFTELGKNYFSQGLFIDTTEKEWSKNALQTFDNQSKDVRRVGLNDIEESNIDWSRYKPNKAVILQDKKTLRPHQQQALDATKEGFEHADRGKLIMACGTGKTFTSLKIAEELAGEGKRVLFAVPSIALMSQTITEWMIETSLPIQAFSVCSDASVGKRASSDDIVDLTIHDLAYPATTHAQSLAAKANIITAGHMQVIFCTYQSIQVVSDAQKQYGLADFDLIICDEAHRTTGVILEDKQESNFTKIHDNAHIKAKKRLYMTATPRIYGSSAKKTADEGRITLCSMDDETVYGSEFYNLKFSEAVDLGLLTDYKVIVLAANEEYVAKNFQTLLSDKEGLFLDDATKLIGCYKALTKIDFKEDILADQNPMRRAVSFCKTVKISKALAYQFPQISQKYAADKDIEAPLECFADHVDGKMNTKTRNKKLSWLKQDIDYGQCRILSNARCLSEGVDVPALDAVIFMHPRKSVVDVVQSVGRVMRRAEGKHLGYVILPIAIPADEEPEEHLNNSDAFQVVWQVLNALRSHDERLDAEINKIDLGERKSSSKSKIEIGSAGYDDDNSEPKAGEKGVQLNFHGQFDEFKKAIYAKLVKKCGTRNFWGDWASDIAKIAKTHITRITALVGVKGSVEAKAFDDFLEELQDDLNESVTKDDAIEMLAQHIITKPVFDALFSDYHFTEHNPVSKALNAVLSAIDSHNLEKENQKLEKFYQSVKTRAEGIESIEAKQKIIVELYDKFFATAFPKTTEKLGIVYTPVEVVDFIIHSVNHILKTQFNSSLGAEDTHILDPFTGTGTFITRLMQSGLISKEELRDKFKNEIHANEIVLLAYYIASINIEQVYHDIMGEYTPFGGICLTDTFALEEGDDLISRALVENSNRRTRQKNIPVKVIIGNPPYSAGQGSQNDNNQNVKYPLLDKKIEKTYVAHSQATLNKSAYDSYIRAIRWASDRIGDSGVIGFVTNAGFMESAGSDGMRKCLAEEFSDLYFFHLRGNQRTSGELSRKEGGKIFDSGSRAPIVISILVKNPQKMHPKAILSPELVEGAGRKYGNIHYYDIGDYLNRAEKLDIIKDFKSIEGIEKAQAFKSIIPDSYNDWLNQRDPNFEKHIALGNKKDKKSLTIFENYSQAILTSRDAWAYNASKDKLIHNMKNMINFYNHETQRYQQALAEGYKGDIKNFINYDAKKISWSRAVIGDLSKNKQRDYNPAHIMPSLYRPFTKQYLYFTREFNEMVYQMPQIFPKEGMENLVICVPGIGSRKDFMPLITDTLPSYDNIEKGQCFPLYLYEKIDEENKPKDDLFTITTPLFSHNQNDYEGYNRRHAIKDSALAHFKAVYEGEPISKEDLFYYIYGILHSTDYRKKYGKNLAKQLPHIPRVKKPEDFWAFSQAGRELADLHINYEKADKYPLNIKGVQDDFSGINPKDYYVTKMKFGTNKDRTKIIYNHKITIEGIPERAYEYVVNGKSPIEWAMDRQGVKTDKASGIINDANDYAVETMNNPAYPLELIQRLTTISLKTLDIIDNLPKLDILED